MRKTKARDLLPSDQAKATSPPGLEQDVLEVLLAGAIPIAPPPDRVAAVKLRMLERVRTTARMLENTLTIYSKLGEWMPVARGVSVKMLHRDDSGYSFLLRLEPGATLPGHPHDGDEECMVVEGEACIGDLSIVVGDYHLARRGSRHADMVSPAGALLFIRRQAGPREGARK